MRLCNYSNTLSDSMWKLSLYSHEWVWEIIPREEHVVFKDNRSHIPAVTGVWNMDVVLEDVNLQSNRTALVSLVSYLSSLSFLSCILSFSVSERERCFCRTRWSHGKEDTWPFGCKLLQCSRKGIYVKLSHNRGVKSWRQETWCVSSGWPLAPRAPIRNHPCFRANVYAIMLAGTRQTKEMLI